MIQMYGYPNSGCSGRLNHHRRDIFHRGIPHPLLCNLQDNRCIHLFRRPDCAHHALHIGNIKTSDCPPVLICICQQFFHCAYHNTSSFCSLIAFILPPYTLYTSSFYFLVIYDVLLICLLLFYDCMLAYYILSVNSSLHFH